jgi:L-lactate dehydrogenase (cytochrome)
MKMCGVTNLGQLHPGYLNTLALNHLIPDKLDGRSDDTSSPLKSRL